MDEPGSLEHPLHVSDHLQVQLPGLGPGQNRVLQQRSRPDPNRTRIFVSIQLAAHRIGTGSDSYLLSFPMKPISRT